MKNNISIILSIVSIIGLGYLVYYQNIYIPNKLKECNEIAVNFEKIRHSSPGDLTVTNQDITGYMKNMVSCFSDR